MPNWALSKVQSSFVPCLPAATKERRVAEEGEFLVTAYHVDGPVDVRRFHRGRCEGAVEAVWAQHMPFPVEVVSAVFAKDAEQSLETPVRGGGNAEFMGFPLHVVVVGGELPGIGARAQLGRVAGIESLHQTTAERLLDVWPISYRTASPGRLGCANDGLEDLVMPVWTLALLPATVLAYFLVNLKLQNRITVRNLGISTGCFAAATLGDWWKWGPDSCVEVHGLFVVVGILVGFVASACLGMYLALRSSDFRL